MNKIQLRKIVLWLLMFAFLLVACEPKIAQSPTASSTNGKVETPEVIIQPSPTPTKKSPSVLNVCTAQEPESLYRYDGRHSLAKQSIFDALYGAHDGMEGLINAGDALRASLSYESVDLEAGMTVLAADGSLQNLKTGLELFFKGTPEAIIWNPDEAYQILRPTITYTLKEGQRWSDGEPLTAHDVLFSYQLSKRLSLPSEQWAHDRTATLEMLDEHTLKWTGIPGFYNVNPSSFFWQPMPAHVLKTMNSEQIANHPMATLTPPGWHAWRITDWAKGKHISFEKNPYYQPAHAQETGFDFLNFIFVPDVEQALAKLEAGECQILDKSYQLESLNETRLLELANNHQLIVEDFEPVEQLVFGIYSTTGSQGILKDERTRQLMLSCLDAQDIAGTLLDKDWIKARVPDGVDITQLTAESLAADLTGTWEDIGWMVEGSPDGIRIAYGVPEVADGMTFRLSLLSGPSAQSQAVAQQVVARLRECGIDASHESLPLEELYAPAPEGPLFGGHFDLALLNWGQLPFHPCELYTSAQIPSAENYWIGTNIAGLREPAFDQACAYGGLDADGAMTVSVPAVLLMPQIRVWLASKDVQLGEAPRFEHLGNFTPVLP